MIKRIYLFLLSILFVNLIFAKSDIPAKPEPARFVNDYANLLPDSLARSLEDSLILFSNKYGPQIVVVTVSSLNGYEIADFSVRLFNSWGIGSKEKNDGVLILVKPKTESEKGQAFITTGYGVEGNLPDITCSRIVNDIMIPYFKHNDYVGGVRAGSLSVMRACLNDDFSLLSYDNQSTEEDVELDFITVIGIIILLIITAVLYYLSMKLFSLPFWLLGRLFGSNDDSFSEFMKGTGTFGNSFGGSSGGFGGGSSGGGGGGGSW